MMCLLHVRRSKFSKKNTKIKTYGKYTTDINKNICMYVDALQMYPAQWSNIQSKQLKAA